MVFHLFHILIKIYLACRVKVDLEKIFTTQFQPYFLHVFTKKIQIVYSTYYKTNGGINVFKMKNKKTFQSTFLCFCKKLSYFQMGF
jgi:hypothetical protein